MAIQAPVARLSVHARRLALASIALLGSVAHATRPLEGADSPIGPQRFFQNDRMTGASISPDGQTVAITTAPSDADRVRLITLDLKTMKFTAAASYSEVDVNSFDWVNSHRLVFDLDDRKAPIGQRDMVGQFDSLSWNPGLFMVNTDGSGGRQLISQYGQGFLQSRNDDLHTLPADTQFLQVIGDGTGDDIYLFKNEFNHEDEVENRELKKFNTTSLKLTTIPTPPHTFSWLFDAKGELRVVVTEKDSRRQVLARDPATNQWTQLADFDRFFGGFVPKYIDENGTLYVEATNGGDKWAVWKYDLAHHSLADKPFLVSPRYDLRPTFLTVDGKLAGLRFDAEATVTQWISPDLKALQDKIDKILPYTVNELSVASHGDGHFVVVRAFADRVPNRFFLYDTQQGKLMKLGEAQPGVDPNNMAAMEPVHYAARDGLDIPAYLTIPHGVERKNLPLVLLVHGGPNSRGRRIKWDPQVQFLAAHGYAVLEPEFRGSTGYGTQLYRAGMKQWGLAMQDDLADGVKWAVAQGIVDPKRVCIAGASYGGYAALMGLAKDPGLYRCGIDWLGVTDIQLLFSKDWSDVADSAKKYEMTEEIGDPKADKERLWAASPIGNVDKIHAPVLMVYGGKDTRVPVEHGERFRDALMKQPGAKVEWVVYKDQGHGWYDLKTNIDFWNRFVDFLDANIGPNAK